MRATTTPATTPATPIPTTPATPVPTTPAARRFRHLPALDGLRALAIALVILFHAGLAGFSGGRAGVDVFFVLSGFLITSLLLDEHRRTGAVRLGAFWMRRVLRLYPALLVTVAGAVFLAWLKMPVFGDPATSLRTTVGAIPWVLGYSMNVARAAGWSGGGFLGHAWSLAIEEQFYLVWPVLVVLVLRRRTGTARLGWIALACALTSAVLRAGLTLDGRSAEMLYNFTFTHVDGVFAGCAFAVLWSRRPDLVRRLARPGVVPLAAAAAAVVVVWGRQMNTLGYPVVVLATLAVLAGVLTRPGSRLAGALSHPAAVAVGRRSYGIYLYHWPIFLFLGLSAPGRALTIGVPLSLAAAWISYAVVEGPFLALKKRWSPSVASASGAPTMEAPPCAGVGHGR